jgi:hypothetical protein
MAQLVRRFGIETPVIWENAQKRTATFVSTLWDRNRWFDALGSKPRLFGKTHENAQKRTATWENAQKSVTT